MFVYVTSKKYVFSMVSKNIQQPPPLPQSLSLEPNSSKFMSDEVHAVQVKPNAMQCLVIHRIGTHACKDANLWLLHARASFLLACQMHRPGHLASVLGSVFTSCLSS